MESSRPPRTELPEGGFVGNAGPRDRDFQRDSSLSAGRALPPRGGGLCISGGFSKAQTPCRGAAGAEGPAPWWPWEIPPASQEAGSGS